MSASIASIFYLSLVTVLAAKVSTSCDVVDDKCLKCLCMIRTGCDIERECTDDGQCGLFGITKLYWLDGGKKVIIGDNPNAVGAFERCVLEPFCATETVRGFYNRYQKAVNPLSNNTCVDLVVKHIHGIQAKEVPKVLENEVLDCYKHLH
ncbi:lysozyme [Anabrus simplex]|uniref:lysozyme n=1 Tax=Anabrus simplex TaxID=316456 RepID=UPI0035A35806